MQARWELTGSLGRGVASLYGWDSFRFIALGCFPLGLNQRLCVSSVEGIKSIKGKAAVVQLEIIES